MEKQNKYEFFIGTNLHVLNYTVGFEKDDNQTNKYYKNNWNGGFVSKQINAQGNGWVVNDVKTSITPDHNKKFRYETLERTQKRSAVKFRKYDFENDVRKLKPAYLKMIMLFLNILLILLH